MYYRNTIKIRLKIKIWNQINQITKILIIMNKTWTKVNNNNLKIQYQIHNKIRILYKMYESKIKEIKKKRINNIHLKYKNNR